MRESTEFGIVSGLLFNGKHLDNPFEIDEINSIINDLDVELFKNKYAIFLVKAIKKLNEKYNVVTAEVIGSYLEINSPKWVNHFYECEVMVNTQTPLSNCLIKQYIKRLRDYNKKDKIIQLGI